MRIIFSCLEKRIRPHVPLTMYMYELIRVYEQYYEDQLTLRGRDEVKIYLEMFWARVLLGSA